MICILYRREEVGGEGGEGRQGGRAGGRAGGRVGGREGGSGGAGGWEGRRATGGREQRGRANYIIYVHTRERTCTRIEHLVDS